MGKAALVRGWEGVADSLPHGKPCWLLQARGNGMGKGRNGTGQDRMGCTHCFLLQELGQLQTGGRAQSPPGNPRSFPKQPGSYLSACPETLFFRVFSQATTGGSLLSAWVEQKSLLWQNSPTPHSTLVSSDILFWQGLVERWLCTILPSH